MSADIHELPSGSDPAQFARAKWAWLDMIASDCRVSASAFKMAYLLASRFLNRSRGYAYPPQRALGKLLGIKERQVRKLLYQLIDLGYVEMTRCGKQMPNEYRIAFPKTDEVTGTNCAENSGTKSTGPYQPSEQPFEGGLQPPFTHSSTLDGSRVSRLDGAPLSPAKNQEPNIFRVGDQRRNASGDRYEVLAVDEEARTVTVRFTETGKQGTVKAPDGSVLIPQPLDDLDDEIPW